MIPKNAQCSTCLSWSPADDSCPVCRRRAIEEATIAKVVKYLREIAQLWPCGPRCKSQDVSGRDCCACEHASSLRAAANSIESKWKENP